MKRLEGKVAVITGATSGIGESTARCFVEEGARVVLAGRNEAKGERLVAELGQSARFVRTDVTRETEIEHLIAAAIERFGRLDCMFNNAGEVSGSAMVAEVTETDLETNFRNLVWSVAFGSKYAVRQFRSQGGGGVVLNNASIAATRTGYGGHLYSAAKAAVIQLTRSYAMETAAEGIRFNSISPGVILTPIFARAFGAEPAVAEQKIGVLESALAAFAPLRRSGWPTDIAALAAFLASDAASFITAQDIIVDGGTSAGRTAQQAVAGFNAMAEAMGLTPQAPLARS